MTTYDEKKYYGGDRACETRCTHGPAYVGGGYILLFSSKTECSPAKKEKLLRRPPKTSANDLNPVPNNTIERPLWP